MSIDYGMGRVNRDPENGIRYGVISQHSVSQAWADSAEPDYGAPTCPKCGREMPAYDEEKHGDFDQEHGCSDYACELCEKAFDSSESFQEEPLGWNYEGDGYRLTDCLDSDVFVLKSPYYTHADFCSPCVPGAGNLDNPMEDGPKTYCLGHDWFEGGVAPYPVYSVATGEMVLPESAS